MTDKSSDLGARLRATENLAFGLVELLATEMPNLRGPLIAKLTEIRDHFREMGDTAAEAQVESTLETFTRHT